MERRFGEAMIRNDADAIGWLLSDDWMIVDPDGSVIDKSRFLAVIKSGALRHEAMDSEDIRVAPMLTLLQSLRRLVPRRNIWGKSSRRMKGPPTYS